MQVYTAAGSEPASSVERTRRVPRYHC